MKIEIDEESYIDLLDRSLKLEVAIELIKRINEAETERDRSDLCEKIIGYLNGKN